MRERINIAAWRLAVLMLLYSIVRLCYFIYNFRDLENENFLFAFAHGLRFDLSAILIINAVFFLLWLLPIKWQDGWVWRLIVHPVFILANTLFIALSIVDIELINFHSRRLTLAFFTLKQDVGNQLPQLIVYYWWLALGVFMVGFSLSWLMPRRSRLKVMATGATSGLGRFENSVLFIFYVCFVILGIRGGFQSEPLDIHHAFHRSPDVGHMSLNTAFNFLQSPVSEKIKAFRFFTDEEANRILEARTKSRVKTSPLRSGRPKNVVVIILESFSREYMGEPVNNRPGYSPFLDSMVKRSLFLENAFANGKRSIEALPTVLASFPSLLNEPFMQSNHQNISMVGISGALKKEGYISAFFHGAQNGSMFFDAFTMRIGFDYYHGLNEYPADLRDRDFDGTWGILDEPFLQHFAQTISTFNKPFLAAVFTLTSHQPYPVPPSMKDRFPKGDLPIHESIGYTDYALKQFFETASRQPWYKDTLFVITADHTQKTSDPNYRNFLGRYRVPLLFFKDGETWSGVDSARVAQQADITPTILDLMGFEPNLAPYVGESAVGSHQRGFVVNKDAKGYWYFDNECFLWIRMDKQIEKERGPDTCMGEPLSFFKAYVQNFTVGVIENRLYQPRNQILN